MTNDEILINNQRAFTGKWVYKNNRLYISGWFFTDPEIKQTEGYVSGKFRRKKFQRT